MKKIVLITSFLFYLLLFTVNSAYSLETEVSKRQYCVRTTDMNFDIQVHPELHGMYVSFYNPHPENISDLYFETYLVDNSTNKILDQKNINISILQQNEIVCLFLEGLNLTYNKYIDLFFSGLQYKMGDAELSKFYTMKFNDAFKIDKCVNVNRWNRKISIDYMGNKESSDEIIFEKICNGRFSFYLEFENTKVPKIPVDSATITYGNVKDKQLIIKTGQNFISFILDDDIPLFEPLQLKLNYKLPVKTEFSEKGFMILYPFSSFFKNVTTGNLIPKDAYLINLESDKKENIKDVEQYNFELGIPEGFTHKEYPIEVEIIHGRETIVNEEENNSFEIVHPSFSCLNVSSIPMSCLVPKIVMTPKVQYTSSEIIWSSPIINGKPKSLTYEITENIFYRFVWVIILIFSIFAVYFPIRNGEKYTEFFIAYVTIYLGIRFVMKIPSFITFYDVLFILTLFIMIPLFASKKRFSGFKLRERINQFFKK